ncbi:MAG: hypothetical protein RR540_01460 [Oscillospiraceae bacterium]
MENKVKKSHSFYIAIIFFLLGIIVGFFISPVKNGQKISCGNGNIATATNTYKKYGKEGYFK